MTVMSDSYYRVCTEIITKLLSHLLLPVSYCSFILCWPGAAIYEKF